MISITFQLLKKHYTSLPHRQVGHLPRQSAAQEPLEGAEFADQLPQGTGHFVREESSIPGAA